VGVEKAPAHGHSDTHSPGAAEQRGSCHLVVSEHNTSGSFLHFYIT